MLKPASPSTHKPPGVQALLFDRGGVLLEIDFDRIFASHAIGSRKPERRAFDHVVASVGVPSTSILLFDDLIENVDAAVATGLQAV